MVRDSSEHATQLLTYTDPVMNPTTQDKKQFALRPSQSPDCAGRNICHAPHVSETLRQACYSNLQEGDWVCGNSWFGSVACCLALRLEPITRINVSDGSKVRETMGIESSVVVKNNNALFPKAPLCAVLKARHPHSMAGKWVVFRTIIQGVTLLAIAYAWCNIEISHVIMTVGNANEAIDPYVSFDGKTGFDGGDTKAVARPEIVDFFFRFLPHIDVTNRLQQKSIQIESNGQQRSVG